MNDKVREMLEKKRQERLAREDIRSRFENLYLQYKGGKIGIDGVREERRKVRNIYLERMQSVRPYDEDYLAEVQSNHDLLLELQREREEFDPEQDVLST